MTTPLPTSAGSIDDLVVVLRAAAGRPDSEHDGEVVYVLEHGLQCAAVLKRSHPDDLELQVAGLVHDLGHVVARGDVAGHGRHGAELVHPVLGDRVAALVELHVPAKRWLVTVDPAYREQLSPTSVWTLGEQGAEMSPDERGAEMSPDERTAFEAEPWHRDAVVLRRADEAAKTPGLRVPGLDRWLPVLEEVASLAAAT